MSAIVLVFVEFVIIEFYCTKVLQRCIQYSQLAALLVCCITICLLLYSMFLVTYTWLLHTFKLLTS